MIAVLTWGMGCAGRTQLEIPGGLDAGADGTLEAAPDASLDGRTDIEPDEPDTHSPDAPAEVCTGVLCSGACVDPLTNPRHCGACDLACPAPVGGSAVCDKGTCAMTCAAGMHLCATACVANVDVTHCGSSCSPCPAPPANATATCDGTSCGFECNKWYVRSGDGCVLGPPQLIAPTSGGTCTSQRPTLRWALPPGTDGASLDLCADRACTKVIERRDIGGSAWTPTAKLAPGTYFWRAFARTGSTLLPAASPTWQFSVGRRDAPVSTVVGAILDVNGDGLADLAISSLGFIKPGSATSEGRVYVYLGTKSGWATSPSTVLAAPAIAESFGRRVASLGDVNGDGFVDLGVGATSGEKLYVYHGGPSGVATTPTYVVSTLVTGPTDFGEPAVAAGDLDGDGYADVAIGARFASAYDGSVFIHRGGPKGLRPEPAQVLVSPVKDAFFGSAVVGTVDFDGDGLPDLAVGAPKKAPGAVYIYRGTGSGLTATPVRTLAGTTGLLGGELASAGDVDGDGLSDLLAVDQLGPPISIALVLLGGDPSRTTVLRPFPTPTLIAPMGLGDINGDGFSDFALGGSSFQSVAIYLGGPKPAFGAPNQILRHSGVEFGHTVAQAGDGNGDGLADIAVGGYIAGAAWAFAGSTSGLVTGPIHTFVSPVVDSSFGGVLGGGTGP